jgi:hypothetical protein
MTQRLTQRMTQRLTQLMNRPREQLGTSRQSPTGRGRAALVAMVMAVVLAALRCSVDVPLGVDPRSDAAHDDFDAGAGN